MYDCSLGTEEIEVEGFFLSARSELECIEFQDRLGYKARFYPKRNGEGEGGRKQEGEKTAVFQLRKDFCIWGIFICY